MTDQHQTENNQIRLLPEHLVDQIKAGEVIERPASLLKELVENSLDAHSKKIDIHIRENGLELISIEDDGDGIEFPDLPYAFCRHATSKIERFEDLYALNSFGFRGEALASISSTSRLTCVSTPRKNRDNGGKIIIHGGEQKSLTPHKAPTEGTSIFVKDLFFNTPARLKFVKSKVSEKNALKRTLNSFLLSNPQTTFSIKWDDKEKDFYPSLGLEQRIAQIFFKKNDEKKELIEFEREYEGHRVHGFISRSSSRGNAGKHHYLFANKRLFNDRQLHMGILRSMERFWDIGEIGHYCIMIDVPANQIDVNVHPNKTQVKFLKSSIIFSLLTSAIKEKINSFLENQPNIIREESSNNENLSSYGDINQFSNSPYQEYESNIDTPSGAFEPGSYFKMGNNFAFLKNNQEDKNLLLNIKKLLGYYLWVNIKVNKEMPETHTTPLLISEPFNYLKGEVDSYLPSLKKAGFELDRLDDKTIVLRSIPNYLTFLPIQGVVQILLSLLIDSKQDAFKTFEEKLQNPKWKLNFSLSNTQIDQLKKNFSESELFETRCLREINNEQLENLFNS